MRIVLKVILVLIFLIILGFLGFFIRQYIGFKKDKDLHKTFIYPRLEIADIEIKSYKAKTTDVEVRLLVKNQLPFGITLDSLDYEIYISDKKIINDKYKKTIKLIKDDSSWIFLPMTLDNEKLNKVLSSSDRKGRDSVEYRIRVSFYTDIINRRQFEINKTRLLPLLYIPEVDVNKWKIDSLNFKRAIVLLDIAVKNKNNFPIELKNITYKIAIEDNEWIEGILKNPEKVRKNDVTYFQIPLRLSLKEVGKTIGDYIREGKDMQYKIDLTFNAIADQDMVKTVQVSLEKGGTIRSVLDAKKDKK